MPLAQRIDVTKNYAQALIVTPTRELAQQIAAEFKRLTGKESAVKVLAVTGGRDFELQKHKLENTCHVLIGTPGRLLDHIRKGNVSLGGVGYFVLDEVDEMLKQGFVDDAAELLGDDGFRTPGNALQRNSVGRSAEAWPPYYNQPCAY